MILIRWAARALDLLVFGRCLACGRWIADHTDAQSASCMAAADEVLEEQRIAKARATEHKHVPAWIRRFDDAAYRGITTGQRDYTLGCVLCRRQLRIGRPGQLATGVVIVDERPPGGEWPFRDDIRERFP